MDTRFAQVDDGVTPEVAARRTAFVVADESGNEHLARTRFVSATQVSVEGEPPSTEVLTELADEIGWWSPGVREITWGSQTVFREAEPLRSAPLVQLTVGQLTVDAAKVASARAWITGPDEVTVSCCVVDGETMIVDGNSRAVAAHQLGIAEVWVALEEPGPLQHETRRWCRDAGIVTVADLAARTVDAEEHQRVWIDRCQAWLAANGA